MRRRRVGQAVELRKARKDEQLLKRRNIEAGEEQTSPQKEANAVSAATMSAEEIMYGKFFSHLVLLIIICFCKTCKIVRDNTFSGMMSPDEAVQFKATLACRKILSAERNPPIDHMIRLGVVPRCVEFLTKNHK